MDGALLKLLKFGGKICYALCYGRFKMHSSASAANAVHFAESIESEVGGDSAPTCPASPRPHAHTFVHIHLTTPMNNCNILAKVKEVGPPARTFASRATPPPASERDNCSVLQTWRDV